MNAIGLNPIKEQLRKASQTNYAAQTYIELCPEFKVEERQHRSANNRYTKVKRTLYNSHNCSLGKAHRGESHSTFFRNRITPSETLLNNFLTSEKFKLKSRLVEPVFVNNELLTSIKKKSAIYSKGNPHIVCQTPELKMNAPQTTISKIVIEKQQFQSTMNHIALKTYQSSRKSQAYQANFKRDASAHNKHNSFSIKITDKQRVSTASVDPINGSRQDSKTVDVIPLDVRNKNKPLLMHDWKQLRTVKSESYAIMEYPSGQLILSYRSKQSLEIASLTKIMTCYLIIKLAEEYSKDITTQTHIIGEHIEESTGTTAELIDGDCYTIEQLLYGLMLPSGNDAALALADWGGYLLVQSKNHLQNVKAFVHEMNVRSVSLGFKDTKYGNPHGLPTRNTRSTAYDLCRLSSLCLAIPIFAKIISTRHYKASIITTDNKKREVEWQNTNKLLRRPGFLGIKTGITVTAGPCLASAFTFHDKTYIMVLLRANKVSRRFTDTRIVLVWAMYKLYREDLSAEQKKYLQKLRKKDREFDSDNSQDQEEFTYQKQSSDELIRRSRILRYEL